MLFIKVINFIKNKLYYSKRFFLIAGMIFFGVFGYLDIASAQDLGFIAGALSAIAHIIIELVGKLLIVLIEILQAVVTYNDFINADAVDRGWRLVRDIANMAFLIIFIAIAFATIMRVEQYEWKKLLPKLLIMAILVNFSKTVAGLILDAAQVIMITFVNGFKLVAAGNLIRSFGLNDLLAIREFSGGDVGGVTPNSIAAASILAVVLLVIATITVGVVVLMFLIRIVYLWILIILAPIAFLLAATPGFSSKFNDWWNKFIRYAFLGPIMAFFLWLSFTVMAGVPGNDNLARHSGFFEDSIAGSTAASISAISTSDQMLSYIITIALLLLSLSVANNLGVAGGNLAGDALSRIRRGGVKLGKLGALGFLGGGAAVAGYAGYKGASALRKTKVGKFLGRKADDKFSPGLTRGLGSLVAKGLGAVGLGDTRFGEVASELAESGTKLRTIPKSWKARSESIEEDRTAKYAGKNRDIFHRIVDGKKTNYATRQENALVNKKVKEQRDESDGSSEFFLNILKNSEKGSPDAKAALFNLVSQNDFNESALDGELGADIHKDVLHNFHQKLGEGQDEAEQTLLSEYEAIQDEWIDEMAKDEGDRDQGKLSSLKQQAADKRRNSKTLSGIQKYYDAVKEHEEAVSSGQPQSVIEAKQQTEDQAREQLGDMEFEYAKIGKDARVDSDFHRAEIIKKYIGTDDSAAQFASALGNFALEKGGFNSYALSEYDEKTGKYSMTDLYDAKNWNNHLAAVRGKMRNMNSATLLGTAHPTVLRNEKIDENGVRTYEKNMNTTGQTLTVLASPNIAERTFANMRADTLAAITGGVNLNTDFPGIFSSDPKVRAKTQRDFALQNFAGYVADMNPMIGVDAWRGTLKNVFGRMGVPGDLMTDAGPEVQKLLDVLNDDINIAKNKLSQAQSAPTVDNKAVESLNREIDRLSASIAKLNSLQQNNAANVAASVPTYA